MDWHVGSKMKAKDVSVSVVDYGGVLFVMATFKLPGHVLEQEEAVPSTRNSSHAPSGKRVREGSRKAKAKLLRQLLETVEFPDG